MFEALGVVIFVVYSVIAAIYSIRMERDDVLKKVYKARSDRDWKEICFAIGLAWPFGALLHYVLRRLHEIR